MQSVVKISEASSIALHAMIHINSFKGKAVSIKEIVKHYRVSENHMSKILQRLAKAGYLESVRGPKGGFIIAKKHRNATFLEIFEEVEGKINKDICLFKEKACDRSCCIMGGTVDDITARLKDYLKNTRISDFN
ncbi:Rrf2 family protein [Parelusimicrobium proximum]|uniref:RrF2 family transcriptional regulator n=1 Tax=Parelusimicrobium proximum TaxID=3228953 RepID=UPI003D17416E